MSATTTPLPSLVPTQLLPTADFPTDEELISLLKASAEYWFGDLIRQQMDVDGDGSLELVVQGSDGSWLPYVAILGRANDSWEIWLYTDETSHYCGSTRVTVEANRVIADFLHCGGGTGVIVMEWEQRWIQCQKGTCAIIWKAPLLWTGHHEYMTASREYHVSEVLLHPDGKTIELTTHRFGVELVPATEAVLLSPNDTYRFVGPDTVEVFRWNGSTYQLESRTQLSPGMIISSEFDLLTQETVLLLRNLDIQKAEFWGLPNESDVDWGTPDDIPAVATHTGTSLELGQWVAGLVSAKDRPLCRLTVQQHTAGTFSLLGRIDLPCIANFTHLAWADVTGDGKEELLLRTIPPNQGSRKTGASFQRLYVYSVGDELTKLAKLDGGLNGPDGEGVRWIDTDGDGTFEILLGLPLLDIENKEIPDTLERRFQVFYWETSKQKFVAGDIWTPGDAD